jgi:4-amino-4-deoxychorismate lyase
MSPFIETIKLLDGELKNLSYHQARFNRTRSELLGLETHPLLISQIPVLNGLDTGLFKCRVLYGKEIERIEYEPHFKLEVNSLKLVASDTVSYGYKYSDRSSLEALYEQRGSCDDILIVKHGCITDSYYANVVLYDGTGWFTPDTPLLPGTMRAHLLEKGSVREARIGPGDLGNFQKIRLINAMHNLEEGPEIDILHVH